MLANGRHHSPILEPPQLAGSPRVRRLFWRGKIQGENYRDLTTRISRASAMAEASYMKAVIRQRCRWRE